MFNAVTSWENIGILERTACIVYPKTVLRVVDDPHVNTSIGEVPISTHRIACRFDHTMPRIQNVHGSETGSNLAAHFEGDEGYILDTDLTKRYYYYAETGLSCWNAILHIQLLDLAIEDDNER